MGKTINPNLIQINNSTPRKTAKNMQSGVEISYHSNDDAALKIGRDTDFLNCTENDKVFELFNHTNRFTGLTGGYYDEDLSVWKDKDGNVTTKALAFPSDVVIDWSTHEDSTDDFLMIHAVENGLFTWDDAFTYAAGLTVSGFSWRLPNVKEGFSLYRFSIPKYYLNYEPFNFAYTGFYWTSTGNTSTLAIALYPFGLGLIQPIDIYSSSARRAFAVRTGNVSEL